MASLQTVLSYVAANAGKNPTQIATALNAREDQLTQQLVLLFKRGYLVRSKAPSVGPQGQPSQRYVYTAVQPVYEEGKVFGAVISTRQTPQPRGDIDVESLTLAQARTLYTKLREFFDGGKS